MDWPSAAFGAFMCLCSLIFIYDLTLYAVLRQQSLLWHAARTISIAVFALATFALEYPGVFAAELDYTVLGTAAANISVILLAPFLYFFIEPEHNTGPRRTCLIAAGCLAIAGLPLIPAAIANAALSATYHALLGFSLLAMITAIVSALRRGSRAAYFLAFALGVGMLLGMATLLYSLFTGDVLPNLVIMILGALTLEYIITANAVGDRLIQVTREAKFAREEARLATKANRTDPLTGLPNRRALERAFSPGAGRKPSGIAVVDLDHFKQINDRFGHAAGDDVLVAVGEALAQDDVFVARLGGEEFILVLYGKDWAKQAERARRRITAHVGRKVATIQQPITASAGLASFTKDDTLSQTMKRADLALYAAKQAGRNRSLALNFFEDHAPESLTFTHRTAA